MKPATPVMSHVFGSSSKAVRTSSYRFRVDKGLICLEGLLPLILDVIIGAIEFGGASHFLPLIRRTVAAWLNTFRPRVDTTQQVLQFFRDETRVELKGESIQLRRGTRS